VSPTHGEQENSVWTGSGGTTPITVSHCVSNRPIWLGEGDLHANLKELATRSEVGGYNMFDVRFASDYDF
jgi:hypothetical protein